MMDFKNLVGEAASNAIVGTVRRVLNGAIGAVTPAQLTRAIQENQSLWTAAGGTIEKTAALLPSSLITAGRPMYRNALAEYGNTTKLVLAWLHLDNPLLYATILETPGGMDWFDRQVREICGNVGLDYEIV